MRSSSRERSTDIALALFLCWLFSSWISTTSPVGRWVIRTAESVVLTDWPPGPDERLTSMRRSLSSSISTSTSSASGMTITVAVEVWIRPEDSVAGMRWTRCTPPSNLRRLYAPSPWIETIASLTPPIPVSLRLISSGVKRWRSAYRAYIR